VRSRPRLAAGTALFAVAFVVLGLPDFGHGVAWPAMRSHFHRPLADLGTFLAVAAAGYLVVATTAGRLARRWGVEGLVVGSTLASALGLLLVAVAPGWPVVLLGSLVSGAGAGGMDTGFNAAVALREDGRLMGLLHAGYGVGAAIGPLVVGASLAAGDGWRPAYGAFALASLLLVVPLATRTLGEAPPQEPMGSPRGLLLPCLAFVVYVSLEVIVGQWSSRRSPRTAGWRRSGRRRGSPSTGWP
jgi:MFS family permease